MLYVNELNAIKYPFARFLDLSFYGGIRYEIKNRKKRLRKTHHLCPSENIQPWRALVALDHSHNIRGIGLCMESSPSAGKTSEAAVPWIGPIELSYLWQPGA